MTGFDEAKEIKIKLPASATKMFQVINHVAKQLSLALQANYPPKVGKRQRWITTGQLDFRPGGSASYFVSYEENTGFSKQ
jgi:hypothetical protein